MKKKFGKKRYFLDPKEGVSAASFSVEVDVSIIPKGKKMWPTLDVDAGLQLSDGNHQVYLEFDVWVGDNVKTLKDIREKRIRLLRLQDIVNNFVEATNESYDYLESQLDDYHAAYKKREAQKKKRTV